MMNEEERKDKYLPEIIDVEVEPDLDFQLREPEDTAEEEKYEEQIRVEAVEVAITEDKSQDTFYQETYKEPKQEDTTNKEAKSKKDTSFTAFKKGQKANEKKWLQKTGNTLGRLFLICIGVIIGAPLLFASGGVGVAAIGMGVLVCGMAVVMGLVGLGVGAFLAGAQAVGLGAVTFFVSLIGVGGGGLGLLIILAVVIWIKNLIVKMFARINKPQHKEEEV